MNPANETPALMGSWRAASGRDRRHDPQDQAARDHRERHQESARRFVSGPCRPARLGAQSSSRARTFVRAAADLVRRERDRLARLVAQGSVSRCAGLQRSISPKASCATTPRWDRRLEGEIRSGDSAGETIHLLRVPLGVVAAICPWNFPRGLPQARASTGHQEHRRHQAERSPLATTSSCGCSASTSICRRAS